MANRTVKDAQSVRGTNPQYLIEKIIRSRIYDARYWKEECFALSAELLVDKAMELKFIGGVYGGNIKPTPFLCLVLKMLQIQPEKDIIIEFIRQEDFKYVRALGAFYMRLVGTSLDCFKYLEPLYNDYRKLRMQNRQGEFKVTFMDEFIDELLHEERLCDVILPRIQKRHILEVNNELEPRVSALEDDLDEPESDDEELKENVSNVHEKPRTKSSNEVPRKESSRRRRSPSPHRHRSSRHQERERRHHRSRSRDKYHSKRDDRSDRRHRSRSPRRKRDRDHDRKSHHSKH
ncbi:pre-mRNA-splicing factor 38A [Trichonephila clavata]|uniref:Pre-mRNA-splicing factor 38 n=1 Tax=Trichonephila clavata TaxID=2740835 RepID=A0A8X6LEV2_TRICU|nr:pre-mRNA-splicing factor 38A [Trichonephila clavata]GFR05892.1 pre-mRNA-splicing factor 38A [Trichonephila clavata]